MHIANNEMLSPFATHISSALGRRLSAVLPCGKLSVAYSADRLECLPVHINDACRHILYDVFKVKLSSL